MENEKKENTYTQDPEMQDMTAEKKTSGIKARRKKGQKILIQIGVIIIVLFTLVTIAVGNMVTMSSFSTSLSSNITLFEYYLEMLIDNIEEYQAFYWLLDYWRDNASDLVAEGIGSKDPGEIDDILKKLSKKTVNEVTPEDAASLSPEDQKRFAVKAYYDIQEIFRLYQNEDEEELGILLSMKNDNGDEVIILTNAPEDEEDIMLGLTGNVEEIQQVINNTETATKAKVWKWAFTTPGKMMIFGTSIPLEKYTGSSSAEMLGVFSAELVYGDMKYTDHIRRDVICMMLLVLVLILTALYFIVPMPLEKVKKCVSEYSDTKNANELTEKLAEIRSRNEIGAFADEFSALALEMERYTREMEVLAGERERVATELNVAQNIQLQMLPQVFPTGEKFLVFASMEAAKEVGGDFYDCYMIDEDHLVMTIADVSGKGVPAALFMAVSKTMLKNRSMLGGAPSEIFRHVNNWLCEGNDLCMFVTVWLGILTVSTGELVCANAGHENPALRMGDEPMHLVRTEHGSPLGLVEDMEFEDEHYKLSSGDALYVYTDGVPEAKAPDETMFGEERLEAVLSGIAKDDTPETIMRKVSDAVREFEGDQAQYDDCTMLCLVMQ